MKTDEKRCRLYLITPPRIDAGAFADTLASALDAGDVGCVQLRLKDASDDEIRRAAEVLAPVTQSRDVAFIMNDRPDLAALLMVFTAGAFTNAAGMTAPVVAFIRSLEGYGIAEPLAVTFIILAGTALLPLGLGWICASLSRRFSSPRVSLVPLMSRFAFGLVPLGAAVWAAHFLFHLATGASSIVPVAGRILARFGMGTADPGMAMAGAVGMAGSWVLHMEFLLLDLGYLASLFVLWRISGQLFNRKRMGGFLVWAALATLLFASAIWIILQPMEMRGMAG